MNYSVTDNLKARDASASKNAANLLLLQKGKFNNSRPDGDNRKFGRRGSIVWHKLGLSEK